MIQKIPNWIRWGAGILAFSAGCINSTTLVGFTHLSVSHVTGNVTIFATAIASGNFHLLVVVCLTLLAFLAGSVMSGYVVGGRSFRVGKRYEKALLIEMTLLILAFVLLYQQIVWGQMFAAMACGLQNAMVATYSGAVIRTTHLTGLTSDMGSAIGNWLAGRPINKLAVLFQAILWYCYCGGAVVGAVLFVYLEYVALLLPICIIGGAALAYQLWLIRLGLKFKQVREQYHNKNKD